MRNRRELLRAGISVSVLSAIPAGLAWCTAIGAHARVAMIDRNLPGAAGMVTSLGRFSTGLHIFAGDPGRLWMYTIEPALRTGSVSLAGFTSAATLFCLQYLSRDYGLELAARRGGAVPLERLASGQSELVDLRASRFGGHESRMTWVLAPKGR
jgi:hypothetical protein